MSGTLAFDKLEALGNDFVLVDGRGSDPGIGPAQARKLADRRRGIGCDQVLVLLPGEQGDVRAHMQVWNADGSRAEQCGNGLRAVALWLHQRGEISSDDRLDTEAGPVTVRFENPDQIRVSLGKPQFGDGPARCAELSELETLGRRWHWVALGNPHLVIERRADEPPLPAQLAAGLAMQANVGLVHVRAPDHLQLAVHERGAGPTPACGSGAAAAAVAMIQSGQARSPVTVEQHGGRCVIHWNGIGHEVSLVGAARHVFSGRITWQKTP